jgi:hypothetical protein
VEASTWRSVTFLTISTAIDDPQRIEGFPTPGIVSVYETNIARVATELENALEQYTGRELTAQTKGSLRKLASLSAKLGIQFGVHRARLAIDVPDRGSRVSIGAEYHHYSDGSQGSGRSITVDLVPCPGFVRVGDGRKNMVTQLQLVPCKVYPRGD